MALATTTLALYGVGGAALATSLVKLRQRIGLSQAKHKSLAGHARIARRLAAFVPFYDYDESRFFCSDDAHRRTSESTASCRIRAPVGSLAYKTLRADDRGDTRGGGRNLRPSVHRRVSRAIPIQPLFVRENLPTGSFLQSSSGVTVTDLDGNALYDLTGSYGVNLFGYDFYKDCIERGAERVRDLGPVLGAYHPTVADNVERLREISGLDEVSFHMSGTEAVMQAVRLARYHTGRSHLVRFCGAYHGWWGDVQPGIGNPSAGERHLHALGNVRAHAARSADGGATSPAYWSIPCRHCIPMKRRPRIRL
jgi:glutamate-1-semialdehyde 2,1-aminomutase